MLREPRGQALRSHWAGLDSIPPDQSRTNRRLEAEKQSNSAREEPESHRACHLGPCWRKAVFLQGLVLRDADVSRAVGRAAKEHGASPRFPLASGLH